MLGGGRNSSEFSSGYSNDINACKLGDGCRYDGGATSAHPNSTL